jgi:iron complex outermembrane receptor protein
MIRIPRRNLGMSCLDRFDRRAASAAALSLLLATTAHAQTADTALPDLYVTATRLDAGITGASTTVITAEEIARSPEQTVPGILSRQTGVQVSNMYGGANGARSTVDIRGFGATGISNTLVLINGRRVDVPDLQGVDWGSIPLNSIERIEVTRGSSGGVLYGDGAVGGVINIVTKSGAKVPPSLRVEGAYGSFNQSEGRVSATMTRDAHALALFGNGVQADGYRDNSKYRQYNGVADYRYTKDWGEIYFNTAVSDQQLGLPGDRSVDPARGINELITDRRGASTPYDFAKQQQVTATGGFLYALRPGTELIVDGGVRRRAQQYGFFGYCFDFITGEVDKGCPVPQSYTETTLTTVSFTPRLKAELDLFGMPWRSMSGFDFYDSSYESPRSWFNGSPAYRQYDLAQTTLAGYAMNTVTVRPGTEVSVGGRVQRTSVRASDAIDPSAPCSAYGCFITQARPYDDASYNTAWHIGLEQRLGDMITLFGRAAQSFRVPNVDERIAVRPGTADFALQTQTSRDIEAGVRAHVGIFDMQWSLYDMYLDNEIHYRPDLFANVNLDPTRRYGSEAMMSARVTDTILLKGGVAYTRSVFREGPFAGNDVPLVARNTASAGVVWNILDERLVFTGDVRFVGSRRMDNDQANRQPLVPAVTLVDVRLGGRFDRYFWSVAVQNLFDQEYFDYAVASTTALGRYNAYPLAGRTFMVRAGATF